MNAPLVSLDALSVHYPLGRRLIGKPPVLKAIDQVSLDIPKGSFFGLVGESAISRSANSDNQCRRCSC